MPSSHGKRDSLAGTAALEALPGAAQKYTARPAPPVAATSSPDTAQALSEARNTVTNATSEASTMRQIALPRGESGEKSCRSASSGATPSCLARAASRLGVRSVRVVPGWMQLTVIHGGRIELLAFLSCAPSRHCGRRR